MGKSDDLVTFCESVRGTELHPWQEEHLKLLENTDVKRLVIPIRRTNSSDVLRAMRRVLTEESP